MPNADAPRVVERFRLRGEGHSYRTIEERTGIRYSTVKAILDSRIYRGEVLDRKKEWQPGRHEALVSEEEWQGAHRGSAKGSATISRPSLGPGDLWPVRSAHGRGPERQGRRDVQVPPPGSGLCTTGEKQSWPV